MEIVHPHTPKTCALIGLLGKALRRKVVLTLEGDPLEEIRYLKLRGRVLGKAAWLLSLSIADALCPCSKWLANVIVKRHGEVKGRVTTVHNPIDFDRFEGAKGEGVKEELGVKGLMVLTPARLEPVKGVDVLIKAAKEVVKRFSNAYFVVAGDGPLREGLRRLAEELGVANNVIFTGFRGDVERLIAACNVLVLPSTYEPFGMPAAEAGACRKPVVASDVGGLREIVRHGETGFKIPPRDHKAMAETIVKLLEDAGLREQMGLAGYRSVKSSFTPERVARRTLKVYAGLMAR